MASFNKVILMGNLTRDPDLRVTPNGASICKIGIAVSRVFKTQDGSQREETTFVDIDAFGRQAEVIAKYFAKGRPILVEGRLKFDQWDDKTTGQKRSKLGVVLENFQFVGSARDNDSSASDAPSSAPEGSPPTRGNSQASPSIDNDIDEDVPF